MWIFLCLVLTKKMQTLVGAPHGGAARCAVQAFRRRGNLGGGGIYFRRAFQIPTDTIKITTPFGVVIFMVETTGLEPVTSCV